MVALAYRYVLDDGVITDARMTLGAVAPVPMRRKKAEAYLIGRKPSGETALGAAKLALEGALPPVSYTHLDVYKRQGLWQGAQKPLPPCAYYQD